MYVFCIVFNNHDKVHNIKQTSPIRELMWWIKLINYVNKSVIDATYVP